MILTDCILVTSVSGLKSMVLLVVKHVYLLLIGGDGSRENVQLYSVCTLVNFK